MIRQYTDIHQAIHARENVIKEINDLILPITQANIIHYGKENIIRQNAELHRLKRIAERDIATNTEKIENIKGVLNVLDSIYSEVLKRKHIYAEGWFKIAEEMNYSERHIHRIYKKALAHFEILIKSIKKAL